MRLDETSDLPRDSFSSCTSGTAQSTRSGRGSGFGGCNGLRVTSKWHFTFSYIAKFNFPSQELRRTHLHSEATEETLEITEAADEEALERAEAALAEAALREEEIEDKLAESVIVAIEAVADVKELQKSSTREIAVLVASPDSWHQYWTQLLYAPRKDWVAQRHCARNEIWHRKGIYRGSVRSSTDLYVWYSFELTPKSSGPLQLGARAIGEEVWTQLSKIWLNHCAV